MPMATFAGSGRRRWTPAAALVTTVLAAGLINPSMAQASVAQGVIAGSGVVTDDFGDEGTLSRNSPYNKSNAVGLWQTILEAEHLLDSDDVDCQFGPTTEAATKSYQRRFGLTADGLVGPNTWSKADNYLSSDNPTESPYATVYYDSPSSYVGYLRRVTSTGHYMVYFNGVIEFAYYNSKSAYCN